MKAMLIGRGQPSRRKTNGVDRESRRTDSMRATRKRKTWKGVSDPIAFEVTKTMQRGLQGRVTVECRVKGGRSKVSSRVASAILPQPLTHASSHSFRLRWLLDLGTTSRDRSRPTLFSPSFRSPSFLQRSGRSSRQVSSTPPSASRFDPVRPATLGLTHLSLLLQPNHLGKLAPSLGFRLSGRRSSANASSVDRSRSRRACQRSKSYKLLARSRSRANLLLCLLRTILLLVGWAAFALLSYRVATSEAIQNVIYNPFELLGISEVGSS
jgi:hypothetical protein